jgi:hypothetical protein
MNHYDICYDHICKKGKKIFSINIDQYGLMCQLLDPDYTQTLILKAIIYAKLLNIL